MFFTLIYTKKKKKNQDHECHSDQKTKTEKKSYQTLINIL